MTLGACSSSDSSTVGTDTSVVANQSFNDDDVMFAQMMIPHHEQAIEMADIALDPTIGASEAVRELATEIKNAQDPEIAFMKDVLAKWNKPTEMDSSMDHSDMMDGMLSLEELDALGALRGTEFDTAWLEAMIRHHEGAISMAEDLLEDGVNPELIELGDEIIKAQQIEIDAMKALL
jgi:uncharacterized protein (DUF305 family)